MTLDHKVRSIERGLDILVTLNQFNGLGASDLSKLTKLPRPTVYRILKTLIEAGYVIRAPADSLFRLSRNIRTLNNNYMQEASIAPESAAVLQEYAQEIVWPVCLTLIKDGQLVIEAVTDQRSPLVIRRTAVGAALPVLSSAEGIAFLAFSSDKTSDALLKDAALVEQTEHHIRAQIHQTREAGYSQIKSGQRQALAVPLFSKGVMIAALSIISDMETGWPAKDTELYARTLISASDEIEAHLKIAAAA